jgi:hypothetical protein
MKNKGEKGAGKGPNLKKVMNEKSVITLVPVVGHIKQINYREPGKK